MPEQRSRRSFLRDLVAITSSGLSVTSCLHRVATRRLPRVGFMSGNEPLLVDAFQDELRKLGYMTGKNIQLEVRLAQPNTNDTATHAAELTSRELDFIVVGALGQALAVRRANPNVPMIIVTCPGMVSNGFARTLERPGGLYTGMDELPPGVTARRLEFLKMASPSVSRVALLSTTPGTGGHEAQLADAESASARLGVTIKPYRATTVPELRARAVPDWCSIC